MLCLLIALVAATAPSLNTPQIRTDLIKVSYLLDRRDGTQPYLRNLRAVAPTLFGIIDAQDAVFLDRVRGSLVGLATGDTLGAHLEFETFLKVQGIPEILIKGGGHWNLEPGQWTDDTSMALCLASSLIKLGVNLPRDQMEHFEEWNQNGHLSSTGDCFDIGDTTGVSVIAYRKWKKDLLGPYLVASEKLKDVNPQETTNLDLKFRSVFAPDYYPLHLYLDEQAKDKHSFCKEGGSSNGSLMRLAPLPIFFNQSEVPELLEHTERSSVITHLSEESVESCKLYSLFIWAALRGVPKKTILSQEFYEQYEAQLGIEWERVLEVANGSYRAVTPPGTGTKIAYMEKLLKGTGITSIEAPKSLLRVSNGDAVRAMEHALWAFYNDQGSFEIGATLAVRLGNDTDTVAAIYGMLAGACYGYSKIPQKWLKQVHYVDFIKDVADLVSIRARIPPLTLDWASDAPTEDALKAELAGLEVLTPTKGSDIPAKGSDDDTWGVPAFLGLCLLIGLIAGVLMCFIASKEDDKE